MSGRIEIVGRVSGRRRWTVEEKLAILRDAFGPDGSVRAAVERRGSVVCGLTENCGSRRISSAFGNASSSCSRIPEYAAWEYGPPEE